MKPGAEAVRIPATQSRPTDFVALAKPRLNLLVVVSAVAGYVMAERRYPRRVAAGVHDRRHRLRRGRRIRVQPDHRTRARRADAAHAPAADAGWAARDARRLDIRNRPERRGPGDPRARSQPAQRGSGVPDDGVVCRRLHAAQAALVVLDGHRRDPGSAAARSSAGPRRSTSCRRARGSSSASCFCGSCRTSWRSHGSIGRTTPGRGSRCCP